MLHDWIVMINVCNTVTIGGVPVSTDEPPSDDELGVRPFNARSMVLSVLLGLPEPRLPAAAILRLAEPFGVAPGTMRTALSRMVAAGELVNHGGDYELRGRLLERKAAQDIGRRPPRDAWDGTWWIAVVTVPNRTVAERREFRTHMVNARMGELRPETWLRPANIAGPRVRDTVAVVRGPLSGQDAVELVQALWNLPAIESQCRLLIAALDDPELELPAMMQRAAAVVRFLREEPLLPRSLTPEGWPADELRERYRDLDRHLGLSVRAFVQP
jgi:phenylacetic acid degradation operon negative regulatory protein